MTAPNDVTGADAGPVPPDATIVTPVRGRRGAASRPWSWHVTSRAMSGSSQLATGGRGLGASLVVGRLLRGRR